MNATQQHMLDVYRSAKLGTPAPPAPGRHDWQVVREIRDQQRVRVAAGGRPARGRRFRTALANVFTSATRRSGAPSGTRRSGTPSGTRADCSRPVAGAGSGACG